MLLHRFRCLRHYRCRRGWCDFRLTGLLCSSSLYEKKEITFTLAKSKASDEGENVNVIFFSSSEVQWAQTQFTDIPCRRADRQQQKQQQQSIMNIYFIENPMEKKRKETAKCH